MVRVSETSLEAYASIIDDLPRRRGEVLMALVGNRGAGMTRQDISEKLGLRINSINGRVRELIDSGMVHERGVRPDRETGRNCSVIYVGADPDAEEGC